MRATVNMNLNLSINREEAEILLHYFNNPIGNEDGFDEFEENRLRVELYKTISDYLKCMDTIKEQIDISEEIKERREKEIPEALDSLQKVFDRMMSNRIRL